MSRSLAAFGLLAALAGTFSACRSTPSAAEQAAATRTEEGVRRRLKEMVGLFCATFVDLADDVARSTTDPALKRRTIVAKSRIVPDARAVLRNENPLDGLIDLWVMSIQFRNMFRSDAGRENLGDDPETVAAAAEQLGGVIATEVRAVVGDAQFGRARDEAERFASDNPIAGDLTRLGVLPSAVTPGESGGLFAWIPSISLSPFGGVGEGISEGAAAIDNFAKVADRFTYVVDDLPDRIAWQLQLFAFDFASNPAVAQVNLSAATVAESSARLATTAETLPADIRREVSLALDDIEPRLASVRATLKDAETAAAGLERTAAAFTGTAQAFEPMAAQLDTTLKTFDTLIHYLNGDDGRPREPRPAGAPQARPFDVLDFERTARSVGAMAVELRATLEGLQALVADPAIGQRIGDVGGTAQDSIRAAIRDATIGAVVVLVTFFGLRLAFRRLAGRAAS